MSDLPRRYKTEDELTPDEQLERIRALRKGKPPLKIETDAYREARAELLRAHGFTEEADETLHGGEQSMDDHLAAARRRPSA